MTYTFTQMVFVGCQGTFLFSTVTMFNIHLNICFRYRRIFQYLLRLKRTQMELEKSWASAMNQDHSEFAKHRNDPKGCSVSQQRRQCFRPMWRVREHMAFLIRNLQFYIQVCMSNLVVIMDILQICISFLKQKLEHKKNNAIKVLGRMSYRLCLTEEDVNCIAYLLFPLP